MWRGALCQTNLNALGELEVLRIYFSNNQLSDRIEAKPKGAFDSEAGDAAMDHARRFYWSSGPPKEPAACSCPIKDAGLAEGSGAGCLGAPLEGSAP